LTATWETRGFGDNAPNEKLFDFLVVVVGTYSNDAGSKYAS
jgi:hypothetical protein